MKLFNLSDAAQYRWMVFGRFFLATIIGFAIANLSVPILAFIFYQQKAVAAYTGLILSFSLWILVFIYVFSVKSAVKAWIVIMTILIVMMAVYWGLKQWVA